MKLLTAFLLLFALIGPARAADYSYRSILWPGAANSAVYAINENRTFVGALKEPSGAHRAIIGTAGSLALLGEGTPLASANESWAYTINHHGDIGGAYIDAAKVLHGYVLRANGAFEIVDRPGFAGTTVYGINRHGSLIGLSYDASGGTHAYVRRGGQFESADISGALQTYAYGINSFEQIVGEVVKTPDTNGYGYIQGPRGRHVLVTAPGSAPEQTYFLSINDRQDVLGGYTDVGGVAHAFLRDQDGYQEFTVPAEFGSVYTSAATINNRGDVVGYYFDAEGAARGFIALRVDEAQQ